MVILTELVYFTLKTLCCCLFDCNFNLIALLQNWKGIFILLDNNFKYSTLFPHIMYVISQVYVIYVAVMLLFPLQMFTYYC